MDEFLEKLASDQERFRRFLRSKMSRLRRMGEVLARCAQGGARLFVAGEAPLDRIASLLVAEYLDPLDAREVAPGAAPEIARRDVLLVLVHDGRGARLTELMETAGSRGALVLIVGSGEAKEKLRARADLSLGLPMRGAKTISEATLVVARVLARMARARIDEERAAVKADEPSLVPAVLDAADAEPETELAAEGPVLDEDEPAAAARVAPGIIAPGIAPRDAAEVEPFPQAEEPDPEAIVAAAGQATSVPEESAGLAVEPAAEIAVATDLAPGTQASLLAQVRPRCVVRFAVGAYPQDASGPAHPVCALSSDTIRFELDPDDESGATLDKGDLLWVRLELLDGGEHVCMRGRVSSIELRTTDGRPVSEVELAWLSE